MLAFAWIEIDEPAFTIWGVEGLVVPLPDGPATAKLAVYWVVPEPPLVLGDVPVCVKVPSIVTTLILSPEPSVGTTKAV